MTTLDQILDEVRELRALIETPACPDDFVDATYVARRTGLKEKTVREGKAGTDAIPRVSFTDDGRRSLVRFQRSAVDAWIRARGAKAAAQQPRQRALRLVARKKRRTG